MAQKVGVVLLVLCQSTSLLQILDSAQCVCVHCRPEAHGVVVFKDRPRNLAFIVFKLKKPGVCDIG